MYRIILFFGFFWISQISMAQSNALIYKSINFGSSSQFIPLMNEAGYAAAYNWTFFINPQIINTGIWDDVYQEITAGDTVYTNAIVVYDEDLIPTATFLFTPFDKPNIYSLSNQKLIMELTVNSGTVSYTGIYGWPLVQNYPADLLTQNGLIEYDAITNTAIGLLNFSAPTVYQSYQPFEGFFEKSYGKHGRDFESQNSSAILGDSILVSYFELNKSQKLNDAINYTTLNGQANLVRTSLNLQTQELSSEQIGSASGSQIKFRVKNASEGGLYRTGLVRGNNTPVSVSGAEISMPPNDSLFHVFITKENNSGTTEWLTELYAYNNTQADTASGLQLRVRNRFFSILETDDALFVSQEISAKSNMEDTLIFRDCFGNTQSYHNSDVFYGLISGTFQAPYSYSVIYKLELNGDIAGRLRYTPTHDDITKSWNGGLRNENKIFEVDGKLAWVHNYSATTNTGFEFEYTGADGSSEGTFIDFPAGKGAFIMWLNMDLSILEHWLIPYECDDFWSIDINAVLPYHNDTLLIQGTMGRGVTTSLDPFGASESFTTPSDSKSSFFAFYSAPEILTSVKESVKTVSFQLYPNPTNRNLYISGIQGDAEAFRIFDISGRLLREGNITDGSSIDVSSLNPGMYIFSIESEKGNSSRKFVVN